MLIKFEALLDAIWQIFPPELVEIYDNIEPNKKGGRILMRKKV